MDSCEFSSGSLSKFTMICVDNWIDGTDLLSESDVVYKLFEFWVIYQFIADLLGDKVVVTCMFRDKFS